MRQSGELSCSPAAGSCSQPFLHKSTIFIHKYQTFQSWRSYPCQGVPVRADFQRHDGSDLRSGVVCPSLDGPSCVRVTCRTISHHQTFPLHGQIKCPDLYSQSVQYRFVVEVQVIKINLGRTQFIICYALKRTLPLFIATSVIPLGSRICEGDRSSLGPLLVSLSLSTSRIGDDDRWHFSHFIIFVVVARTI